MKINNLLFLIVTVLLSFNVYSQSSKVSAQIDTVLQRYRQSVFEEEMPSDIRKIMHSLKDHEQSDYGAWAVWPDIDYRNESRASWELMLHLKRVKDMAVAWRNPHSDWYDNDTLWNDLSKALDFWLFHRFYNPNWWQNEIGVPRYMQTILILLGPFLTSYEYTRCLEEMDQFRINGTGSNLIQSAKLGFYYGALTNDTLLMRNCMDTIFQEIKINTGEGIQPDYSFHMHLNRLQIYSYGRAYIKPVLKLALQCKGTRWAFPSEKVKLLIDFILKGWQWMCRGINTVPGTIDRSVSRKNALHAADIRKLLPDLIKLYPPKREKLKAFKHRQNGTGKPLSGFRYFPYSDFAAYQCPNFSFFLKTISTRTLPAESINGENLKGRLLNSGDAYLIHDGSEYLNLMPVWNWNKLPGITGFKGATEIVRKPFVGSVSTGESGLTAMDYRLAGKDTVQGIRAHKIWLYHDNLVVCLIAGLTAFNMSENVFTVLDQCRLNGRVVVNDTSAERTKKDLLLEHTKWIYHHGFAYIPLKPSTIRLRSGLSSGSWRSISASGSDSLVTDSVFMVLLMHGKQPADLSTGYVLTYLPSSAKVAELADHPSWKILRNDSSCQAVQFDDGTLMAAFFSPGILDNAAVRYIEVSRPCLLVLSQGRLYLSDPTHQGGLFKIRINQQKINIGLPDDGSSVEKDISFKVEN